MKVLVVYYSWSGKTGVVANAIQEKVKQTDIRVIQETRKRKGITGLIRASAGALTDHKSDIKPMDHSLASYDLIVVGSPVWLGHPSTAFNAFVTDTDFNGKSVIVYATAMSKLYKNALKLMGERIISKGGLIKDKIGIDVTGKSDNELTTETALRIEPVIKKYLV